MCWSDTPPPPPNKKKNKMKDSLLRALVIQGLKANRFGQQHRQPSPVLICHPDLETAKDHMKHPGSCIQLQVDTLLHDVNLPRLSIASGSSRAENWILWNCFGRADYFTAATADWQSAVHVTGNMGNHTMLVFNFSCTEICFWPPMTEDSSSFRKLDMSLDRPSLLRTPFLLLAEASALSASYASTELGKISKGSSTKLAELKSAAPRAKTLESMQNYLTSGRRTHKQLRVEWGQG